MKKIILILLIIFGLYFSLIPSVSAYFCECGENSDIKLMSLNSSPELNSVTTENNTDLPEGEISIKVNLYRRRLILLIDGELYKSYPVTIGEEDSRSPVGEWKIINKFPRDEDGPFGSRWMGLNVPWGVYGIHGTNKPQEIGMAESAGCIRLHNEHVEELFEWVPVNTYVEIIGPREDLDINYILRPGDTGKEIRELQFTLREIGVEPGYVDGKYGEKTEKAVNELKTQLGLKDDGITDLNMVNILKLAE